MKHDHKVLNEGRKKRVFLVDNVTGCHVVLGG